MSTYRILLYVAILSIMVLIGAVVLSTRVPEAQVAESATVPTQTVSAPDMSSAEATAADPIAQVTPTIAPATPWGVLGLDSANVEPVVVATNAPTPLPDLPAISLLGPPADSVYQPGDFIVFYWDWPEALAEGLRFSVYMQSDSGTIWAGAAEADNMGSAQQLGIRPSDVGAATTTYQWYVVVEDESTGTILARSEQRPIVVMPE